MTYVVLINPFILMNGDVLHFVLQRPSQSLPPPPPTHTHKYTTLFALCISLMSLL
jgi:hypothetical protein